MLDFLSKVSVLSDMNKEQKDTFNIEFPEAMTPEEVERIKEYIFKFLARHSCKIEKNTNANV